MSNIFDQFDVETEQATEANMNVVVGDAILDSGKSQYGEAELKKATYAVIMDEANRVINDIENKSDLSTLMSEFTGITGSVEQYIKEASIENPWMRNLLSEDVQSYDQAARAWVMAHLRDVSGAAIPPEEIVSALITYFPVVGNEQQQVDEKREARRALLISMRAAGGNAYKEAAEQVAVDKGILDTDRQDQIEQRARANAEFKKKAIEKGLLPPDFK
jgi:hypothetical protein